MVGFCVMGLLCFFGKEWSSSMNLSVLKETQWCILLRDDCVSWNYCPAITRCVRVNVCGEGLGDGRWDGGVVLCYRMCWLWKCMLLVS